jgi:hypothetical protein
VRRLVPSVFVFLFAAGFASQAVADKVIYTCGPSTGYSYYLKGGLAQDADTMGWKKDGIDAGIQLVFTDDHDLDVLSLGSPPNDFRYSAHGCKISSLQSDATGLTVIAVCPSQTELFLFSFNPDKRGELVRADIESSQLSKRGGLLHSDCRIGP